MMSKLNRNTIKPDKKLAAVCGLFCSSCTLYIGNQEDPERLRMLSKQMGKSEEDLHCEGCRSEHLSFYCKTCTLKSCAKEKGFDFCSECEDFPCEEIKKFQKEKPHRAELFDSLDSIRSIGWEKWFTDMSEMSSCRKCGTINSAYDLACRECGEKPGSTFVEKHMEKITEYWKKIRG